MNEWMQRSSVFSSPYFDPPPLASSDKPYTAHLVASPSASSCFFFFLLHVFVYL